MTRSTTANIEDQSNRTVVVTGANSGIGFELTCALAAKGAAVIMACRDQRRGDAARDELPGPARDRSQVLLLDVSDPDSVRAFAERVADQTDSLDLLINNAGIMATPPELTAEGIERQWATNHLGHFALTGLLLPLFVDRAGARVVSVSSLAAAGGDLSMKIRTDLDGYSRFGVYSDTKLANQVFAVELNHRLAAINSPAISVVAHPGVSHTNLGTSVQLGPLTRPLLAASKVLTQSAAAGAQPILRAATDPRVEGGQYFGPAGRRQYRGRPKQVPLIAGAATRSVGRALWEQSMELSGVRYLAGD
jgi:NAD(P)-dependent dehydrogenase (short-subunit alcohol dehydrogenase family)